MAVVTPDLPDIFEEAYERAGVELTRVTIFGQRGVALILCCLSGRTEDLICLL